MPDDVPRPARRFERQIAFATADVDDVKRWQELAEGARPCRPAAAREQLPCVAVRIEVFLAMAQHLLQARLVFPHRPIGRRCGELRRPAMPTAADVRIDARRRRAGGSSTNPASRSSTTRPASLRRPEMARDARLGDAENRRSVR